LANKIVDAGDLVIFTQGDLDGVSGSTNAMKIIEVTAES
jgi:pyruvate kinase